MILETIFCPVWASKHQMISLSNPPPSAIFGQNEGGGLLSSFTFPLGSFGSASPIRKVRGGYLVKSSDIVTPWHRDMEHHQKKCVILGWFYTEMKKKPFFHFLCKNQDFWTLTHHNSSKNDRKCKIFYSEETSNLKERKYEIWYTHHASY